MNWTKLLHKYLPLKDIDRFLLWATENKAIPSSMTLCSQIDKNADSYFESDIGSFYDNIVEYNYDNVESVENEIIRITSNCNFGEYEILARITAVAMLKCQPREITVRERFSKFSKDTWNRQNTNTNGKVSETAEISTKQTNQQKIKDEKISAEPPSFFYPM